MNRFLTALALGLAFSALVPQAQAYSLHSSSCSHHDRCALHKMSAHTGRHHHHWARELRRVIDAPYHAENGGYYPLDVFPGLFNSGPRSVSETPQQWIMNQAGDRPYADDLPY